MASETHELYASQNGDRWSLGWQVDAERLFVLHEANAASGGARTEYGVEDFLTRDMGSPQQRELALVLAVARSA